jgi:two-component system cell cycle response regulator DivK
VAPFVLIVEDQPSHAKLFSEILRGNGRSSLVALKGREGIAVARRAAPALVIVDILLPDLDGRKVISELRGNPETEKTPILAVSAVSDRAMERECLAAGADMFLSKPIGVQQFSTVVAELLAAAAPQG